VRYFCTYFDKNYLSRGLVLYESLRRHHPRIRLYVGCFDTETFTYLSERALTDVVPIAVADLETADPELAATRATRSRVEYYFTSTAAWLRHVLLRDADIDLITYVDADYRFFASAEPLFEEMSNASIAVVEHRFPPRLAHLEDRGRFNVGWLSFRRDEQGLACIEWWRARCIEWCYDRLEPGRFADQKYLDEWPRLFPRTRVLQHGGVSVAPWNLERANVDERGGELDVGGDHLICFHFHGVKHVAGPVYASGLLGYRVPLRGPLRKRVYEPYLGELLAHEAVLREDGLDAGRGRSARYVDFSQSALRRALDTTKKLGELMVSRTFLLAPSWSGA
jgi:hypothetical protein